MLSSLRTSRAFLMSDHAPGCGRFAPRPDPRNGLQQLLSPLLRSFLARQTSCLQPSCAALWALRVLVGNVEIGAAWHRTSKEKTEYHSVKLDDPSFSAPIYANLFKGETDYTLVWSR